MKFIDALFAKANLKCTVCRAPMGGCDCWSECECGWRFLRGEACHNPDCGGDGERQIVAVDHTEGK